MHRKSECGNTTERNGIRAMEHEYHCSTPFANACTHRASNVDLIARICRRRLRKRKLNSRFQHVANETSGQRATNFAYRKTIFRHGHFSHAFNILYYRILCAYVCNAAEIALFNFIADLDEFSWSVFCLLDYTCFFLSTKRVTGIQLFKE